MTAETPFHRDVSVIIPAYNVAATIRRAVLSAAHQTLPPTEIIICDDGSDDGTADQVRSLGTTVNGVPLRLIVQENAGAGAARNRALSAATTTWLAFLDADDEWLPEKLERSLEVLQSGPFTFVTHDYLQVSPDGRERRVDCARRFRDSRGGFSGIYRFGFISTSTVVVSRAAVNRAGGFDETLETAQDFDLWLKILGEPDVSYTLFDAALLRYTVNPDGITSHTGRRLACCLRVAERHKRRLSDLLFRITAVHYEAFTAYGRGGRYGRAVATGLLMIGRLLAAILHLPVSGKGDAALAGWFIKLMWLWVILAFAAYLYRFNHLIVAFFQLVKSL